MRKKLKADMGLKELLIDEGETENGLGAEASVRPRSQHDVLMGGLKLKFT